jgi:hypothetical protein
MFFFFRWQKSDLKFCYRYVICIYLVGDLFSDDIYFLSLRINCLFPISKQVLEGRAYRLQHPWVGVINRSQADINKNVDMRAARQKERDYFTTSPEYRHLAGRMGSEYLAKILSKVTFV